MAAVSIENTPEEFEKALADKGFSLDTDCYFDLCKHNDLPQITLCYQTICDGKEEMQNLPENKSKYKPCRRVRGCIECVGGQVSSLDCGGHYDNIREYGCDYGFEQKPLDPDAPAREIEDKEETSAQEDAAKLADIWLSMTPQIAKNNR